MGKGAVLADGPTFIYRNLKQFAMPPALVALMESRSAIAFYI
jgi:hypothetical protein